MKIVFIIPNYKYAIHRPQLGVLYLSAIAKKYNCESIIINNIDKQLDNNEIIQRIEQEKPDIIGISCLTGFYIQACKISKLLKDNGYIVFMGGVHPTFLPFSTLKQSKADFVICGEGEIPLIKLIENNFNYKNANIKGLYTINDLADDRKTIKGEPIEKADFYNNLDEIPFPDWEQTPPNSYTFSFDSFTDKMPSGHIICSRGCPYQCTFCASKNFWKGIRYRSVNNVISEIKMLKEQYGIKSFHIVDDNLTLKREYIIEFCNALIKNKLNDLYWSTPNGVRADRVDKEILLLMREAGCRVIDFGIESANPTTLKKIKKGETIDQIKKAIEISKECGLDVYGNLIIGFPCDTKKTINESINFVIKSKLDGIIYQPLSILPGSDLYEEYKSNKNINKNTYYRFPQWFPSENTKENKFSPQYIRDIIIDGQYRFFFSFPFKRILKLYKNNRPFFIFLLKQTFRHLKLKFFGWLY